jgi:drug/metabolite transporter (DMT)-like permease
VAESKSKTDHPIAPHLALIAVQIMFGTWPIVGKIALRSISTTSLVAMRIIGAAIIFSLVGRNVGELFRLPKRVIAWLAVTSLLGVVFNQLLFVKGLSLSTAINSTLLTATIPVITLIASILLGYEKGTLRHAIGVLFALVGVLMLVDPFQASFSPQTTAGNILVILSAISYGAYLAVSRNLFRRYGALTVITWIFVLGAIMTIPVAAYAWPTEKNWQQVTTAVWLAVAYVIIVPRVGAYYLNSWAITRVSPSIVAIYIYLQPLLAFGIAPLVLGETLSARIIVACCLVLAGVTVVTLRRPGRAMGT